jgi:hypothetical protein
MPAPTLRKLCSFRISSPVGSFWIWTLPPSLLLALAWAGNVAKRTPKGGPLIAPDFTSLWTAARLALQGKIMTVFSATGLQRETLGLFPHDDHRRVFGYPPTMVALLLVFGLLPYFPSLLLYSIAGLGSLAAALRASHVKSLDRQALALALLSPAAVYNLSFGNNASFAAALFLGGLYLSESAPLAAGALFGLLTVKPHLGILVPFVLLLRRNWACIAAAGGTAVLLAAVTLLFWGIGPWQEYAAVGVPYHMGELPRVHELGFDVLMPGPYVDFAMVPGLPGPRLFYGAAALFALYAALRAVRFEGISPLSVLILALATLIISPYCFCYDFVLIAGALAVYLGSVTEVALPAQAALGLLTTLPATIFLLKRAPLPLSSLIMLAALFCLHRAVRKKPEQADSTTAMEERPVEERPGGA